MTCQCKSIAMRWSKYILLRLGKCFLYLDYAPAIEPEAATQRITPQSVHIEEIARGLGLGL